MPRHYMEGWIRVDLHVHTSHSKDSRTSPEKAVSRAMELGLDAIAVTDHCTVSGSLEAERAARGTGLLVIPGQEASTSDGELVILGMRETLPGGLTAGETARLAKKEGGFVIVPHPFDAMRRGIGKSISSCMEHVDAMEVFNSRTIFKRFNDKAAAFAREHEIPAVIGSDSHFPEEMGKACMLVRSGKDATSIFRAIAAGDTEFVIRSQGMAPRIKRGLMKVRTYF